MRLTCPCCGAVASAEAWMNDVEAREAMTALITLPPAVQAAVFPYLSLFRPKSRALSWARVRKLLLDLAKLTAPGWVHGRGKADRVCPPRIWAMAMEDMVARRSGLSLPLANHNYLRQVAWGLADQADAHAEQQQHQQIVSGSVRANRDNQPPPADAQELTQFERAWLAKHGSLPEPEPERLAEASRLVGDLAKKLQAK